MKWISSFRASTSRSYAVPLTVTVIVREVGIVPASTSASAPRVVRGLDDGTDGEHRSEVPAVVGRGVHIGRGIDLGAATAARIASASAEAGSSSTGTASTQPSAILTLPLTVAAALTMQVPSTPSVTAAKPSARPAGR